LVQLYGRGLLPFDFAKENVLYATLDLIGLNNLAGAGWVKVASVSESWQWMAPRWVGVANITIHTMRDRTGASMGEVRTYSCLVYPPSSPPPTPQALLET